MPAGKSFIKDIYQAQAGVPHHYHIDLEAQFFLTCEMWKVFLVKLRGWMPIVDTKLLHASAFELFADAAGSAKLGWGAWLPHLGFWMYGKWEEDFFQQFNLSIDFLKLYALLAGIITWAPQLMDHAVLFWSDKTLTVFALRNKYSDSPHILFLLCFLTLFCMTHRITILARYGRSVHSKICDKLS